MGRALTGVCRGSGEPGLSLLPPLPPVTSAEAVFFRLEPLFAGGQEFRLAWSLPWQNGAVARFKVSVPRSAPLDPCLECGCPLPLFFVCGGDPTNDLSLYSVLLRKDEFHESLIKQGRIQSVCPCIRASGESSLFAGTT
jgi:hypothetical protein